MYDVLILGGGPAGLTAGIYAARGGMKTVIVEKLAAGGQAATTPEIENYPAFEKISGFELTYKMLKQCESFGVEILYDEPIRLTLKGKVKSAVLNSGASLQAKTVIIATGADAKKLGISREDELIGGGVSYCASCDGAFFKGKPVAVVGGGNTAVEDALYLENFASEVYLIHRRNELRADKILADRIKKSSVKIIWDSIVENLNGTPKLTEIIVKNIKNDILNSICVNGLFVAVGQKPATELLEGIKLNQSGYVITDETTATNVEGVFAAGDVREKALRQVVTAAADGAIAADSAIKYIAEH